MLRSSKLILGLLLWVSFAHAQGIGNVGGSSSSGPPLNGFLTCTAGVCTFTGADGSTQMVVGTTSSAVDFLKVVGGISNAGPSFLCTSASDANVPCNFTAKGTGAVNFANGSGLLGTFADPGAPVTGTPTFTPGIGTAPANISAANGVDINGSPVQAAMGLYALNVNGDFQIDQVHEGASSTGATRIEDGWSLISTANRFTFQRSTTVFPTNAGTYFYSSVSVTGGVATTPAATDQWNMITKLTGQELGILRYGTANAQPATLDVCMEGDSTLTYPASIPIYLNNNGGGGSFRTFLHLVPLSAASTWTCQSIAVPGDTSGTWASATQNSEGLRMGINLGCGSNFQASTLDAWFTNSTVILCTSSSTQVVGPASGHIQVTGFHFRPGVQNYLTSPFQSLPYSLEYTRARQRYWKTFAVGTAPAQNVGAGTGEFQFPATVTTTGTQRVASLLAPNMISTPSTVTFFNPSASNANCRDETAAADGGAAASSNATSTSISINCTGNASTAVNNLMGVHVTLDTGF